MIDRRNVIPCPSKEEEAFHPTAVRYLFVKD